VTAPAPVLPELHAPATWHRIDFISDLHLQAGDPATVDTWKHYLIQHAGAGHHHPR
jgi:UDP-2,3-diacylglucosamine hydrolase